MPTRPPFRVLLTCCLAFFPHYLTAAYISMGLNSHLHFYSVVVVHSYDFPCLLVAFLPAAPPLCLLSFGRTPLTFLRAAFVLIFDFLAQLISKAWPMKYVCIMVIHNEYSAECLNWPRHRWVCNAGFDFVDCELSAALKQLTQCNMFVIVSDHKLWEILWLENSCVHWPGTAGSLLRTAAL